jgi:hypothetical protein
MTATRERPTSREPRRRGRGARVVVAVLLIVSFVATALTRQWAIERRSTGNGPGGVSSTVTTTSLTGMPSYATALLLGGLRGPLVMVLWTSSESQKQQNNLEDIDTKIEWIRLLQPEFDAVHLFQIWNKAYNISVKMTSLANKYATIADAIEYGQKVDEVRPDDLNILSALALTYSDKLGSSRESVYYRQRVRRDTQTLMRFSFPDSREQDFRDAATKLGWIDDEAPISINPQSHVAVVMLEKPMALELAQQLGGTDITITPEQRRKSSDTVSAQRLPMMVDEDGYIFPDLKTPRYPRPADLPADKRWYDGSALQFLKQYEPFPYGLSAFALAYNDYKRAQYLQDLWKETPLQMGAIIVDSRPAILLKLWGQDEWERGRRYEMRAIGHPAQGGDRLDLDVASTTDELSPASVDEVSFAAADECYGLAARLMADCQVEMLNYIHTHPAGATNYYSHVDDAVAMQQLMLADQDYLRAMTATGSEKIALMKSAMDRYSKAETQFALINLKYWFDDRVMEKAYPIDPKTGHPYTRFTIETLDPSQFLPLYLHTLLINRAMFTIPGTSQVDYGNDNYFDDRTEYTDYLTHCQGRLDNLNAALTPPSTQPATQPGAFR